MSKQRWVMVGVALAALVGASGCELAVAALILDRASPEPATSYDPDSTYGPQIEPLDGRLSGSLGEIRNFEGEAYQFEAYGSSVTMHTGARGGADYGWAMTIIESNRSLGDDIFTPGTHIETTDWGEATVGGELVTFSLVGCSGPDQGTFDYDAPADAMVIDILEGPEPDTRIFRFTADYTSYDGESQQVEGELTYRTVR